MAEFKETPITESDRELVSFVVGHTDRWRDHRDTNFLPTWDEYERIYYGIWSDQDKTRDSERSRLVSPAMRQAVENKCSEIMEATTGRGTYFDIDDDFSDAEKADVELTKRQLHEDLKKDKALSVWKEVNRNAEIFGTGVAEILIKEKTEYAPATRPMPGQDIAAIGVEEKKRVSVPAKSIHPRNFLIDPNSESVEDGLGVAIDEYVNLFKIVEGIEQGIYRKVNIQPEYVDTNLEPEQLSTSFKDDKVRVLRYYGLVPREYLEQLENEGSEVADLFPEDSPGDKYSDLVEAIVVIANGTQLLKAERSPYMMKDRPVVAYRPETVPGRFWGVGTIQKGYNMQKAIDAQYRSHLDSLALTTAPMMAADATRLPRGASYKVQPGKTLLVNGNPNEVLFPFKFGNTDPANNATAQEFERMLLQATGTLDSAALTQSAAAGGQGGMGMSLAMSSIVKKNKQALINFQDDFLVPFIKKTAYRYMQFDPENYPSRDFKFIVSSSLGMVAREYEQQQFIGLLQTLGPQSPIVPLVLKSIVQSSSLDNREELATALQQMSQPDPQQQQMQMQQAQIQMELVQSQSAALQAQAQESQANAQESQAKAQKVLVEAELMPEKVKTDLVRNISANLPANAGDKEFEKRAKIAELILKEREIVSKEKMVDKQMKMQ
jgi:hypothetical protein